MSETSRFKLGRIYQTPHGTIVFGRAPVLPGPKQGTRDEWLWWNEVLHDRRANYPRTGDIEVGDEDARYRLDHLRSETVTVHCVCGKNQTFRLTTLIEKFGAASNTLVLARSLFKCGARTREGNSCAAKFLR